MSLALITNQPGQCLLQALENEMKDNDLDSIYILVAYIWKNGVELLQQSLELLEQRGIQIRVITTWQYGISDFEGGVEALACFNNVQVKIFGHDYPSFHAKGWLFRHKEDTARDVVLVGSSNIGKSALTTGVEWNIGVQRGQSPETALIIDQFKQRFDEYWQEPSLVMVNHENVEHIRLKFLEKAKGDMEKWDEMMQEIGNQDQWLELKTQMEALKAQTQAQLRGRAASQRGRPSREGWAERTSRLSPLPTGQLLSHLGHRIEGNIGHEPQLQLTVSDSAVFRYSIPDNIPRIYGSGQYGTKPLPDLEAIRLEFKEAVKANDVTKVKSIAEQLAPEEQKKLVNEESEWELDNWDDPGHFTTNTCPIWYALNKKYTQPFELLSCLFKMGANPNVMLISSFDGRRRLDWPIIMFFDRAVNSSFFFKHHEYWDLLRRHWRDTMSVAMEIINIEAFDASCRQRIEPGVYEQTALGRAAQAACHCWAAFSGDGKVECKIDADKEEYYLPVATLLLEKGADPAFHPGIVGHQGSRPLTSCEFIQRAFAAAAHRSDPNLAAFQSVEDAVFDPTRFDSLVTSRDNAAYVNTRRHVLGLPILPI